MGTLKLISAMLDQGYIEMWFWYAVSRVHWNWVLLCWIRGSLKVSSGMLDQRLRLDQGYIEIEFCCAGSRVHWNWLRLWCIKGTGTLKLNSTMLDHRILWKHMLFITIKINIKTINPKNGAAGAPKNRNFGLFSRDYCYSGADIRGILKIF